MTIDDVTVFLRGHRLAVLATTHANGHPEAAVIRIVAGDDCSLFFKTLKHYRKYDNLARDGRVALVIGWDEKITVQYEGTATELSGEAAADAMKQFGAGQSGKSIDASPDNRCFKVTPTWIRYANLGVDPWEIQEWTMTI